MAALLTILILMTNLFNKAGMASIKASVLLLVVYICAQLYVSSADSKSFEQLGNVFIASCFGCAITFIVAYILLQNGVDMSGIVAKTRAEDGLFMQLGNMHGGKYIQAYRLRGFMYDPNTMFVQFIFGISACVLKLFRKFNLYHVITLILSVICVLLSSSRMGLLCVAAAVIFTSFISIGQLKTVRKKLLSIISILTICALFIGFTVTRYGQTFLSSLLSSYSNRSSLTDEYGRFSIWKECIKVYWEKSPVWGVGLGQMQNYTMTERMTHNTWLEFICECGIIVGSIAILYFLTVMIMGFSKIKVKSQNSRYSISYICVVIGYTVTIISLTSVDNITCSYLWFAAMLLLKMMNDKTISKPKDGL